MVIFSFFKRWATALSLLHVFITGALAADATTLAGGQIAQASSTATPSNSLQLGAGFSGFANAEFDFASWRGSRGVNVYDPAPGKGSQFYNPWTFGLDYESAGNYRLQTRVKTGYANSRNSTPGQEASLSTMVDTQITTTFTYLGAETYRWFAGLGVNAPTGTTYLPNNSRFAQMDPDLVFVGSYGAGWNFNPTTGVVFALNQNTAVSLSVGYAWQGSFNRATINLSGFFDCQAPSQIACPNFNPLGPGPHLGTGVPTFDGRQNVDPSDVFTANANTSSILGNWALKTSFAYMSETNVKVDGLPIGHTGAKFIFAGEATYQIDPRLAISVNGSYNYTGKNRILGTPGLLVPEPKNSNGDVFIGSIGPTYALTERLSAGLNYSYLWRRQNYYDIIEGQYIPAKTKHSLGGLLNYAISPTASLGLKGSYFWVHQYTGPVLGDSLIGSFCPDNSCAPQYVFGTGSPAPPALSFQGWTLALSGRIQF